MPLYARDWMTDAAVSSMSPVARAGYMDLICTSWLNDGIPAPDGSPDRWRALATMARLTVAELKRAWPAIEPHFELCDDGKLRNRRGRRIKQELDQYESAKAEAGRKGAQARWQTDGRRMANA